MRWWRRRTRRQSGQGLTEYIIVVALVAIAAIGVVTVFGDNVRRIFGTSADALAGSSATSTGAKDSGSSSKHRNIKDFAREITRE